MQSGAGEAGVEAGSSRVVEGGLLSDVGGVDVLELDSVARAAEVDARAVAVFEVLFSLALALRFSMSLVGLLAWRYSP